MKFFIIIVLLTIFGCSIIRDDQSERESLIPDSAFKYHGIRLVRDREVGKDYNVNLKQFNLEPLDSIQLKVLASPIVGHGSYRAYFYSKQAEVGRILPILIYLDLDDHSGVALLCLSNSFEVIDHLFLTDQFGDYREVEGRPRTTSFERYSEFVDDSTFIVTELAKVYDGFDQQAVLYAVDSVTKRYRIDPSGTLRQLSKDSLRYSN